MGPLQESVREKREEPTKRRGGGKEPEVRLKE